MKIAVVGGGPAGLYFAILMKKADPRHDVTVHERNQADDTFGFGVVFSDATLDNFEKYDLPSYRRITQEFAYWDDIAIHFRGTVHRIGGNGFCGCARRTLLLILQERARDLGVRLVFGTEVAGEEEFADADLIVAADGINSVLRERHRAHFGPADRSAAEQVRLDGIDEAARRLHLPVRGDAVGAVHRPRLSVRARRLDLGLRDRPRDLPARRPRPAWTRRSRRASWRRSSAGSCKATRSRPTARCGAISR